MKEGQNSTQEERIQIAKECIESEKAQNEIEKLKHQLYQAEMETNLLKNFCELEESSEICNGFVIFN